MSTIFQASNVQNLSLRNSKVTILSKNKSDSSILIFDTDCLVFREYQLTCLKIQSVVCDPNLQFLLMFEEQEQDKLTNLYSASLEKSFTPIAKITIPSTKFIMVDWCNSRICALIFQNDLILYDIFLNKIIKKIQSDFHQISQFTISRKFDQIFCEFQQNINTSLCLVLPVENQAEVQKFDNCVACKLMEEQDQDQLLLIQYKSNNLFILLAKFDDGFKIEREIQQNLSDPPKGIRKVGYRKNKKELLLIDSSSNLHIYSINSNYQMQQQIKCISNIVQFNISLLDENLIMLDIKNQLIFENLPPDISIRPPYPVQSLTIASQVKKRAMQGILTDQSNLQSSELLIQQYHQDFENLSPKFTSLVILNPQFRFLPLVDYRVLNLNYQSNQKFKELIPKMETYAETQSVKKHLIQLEAALNGDNPILCEGSAACGKTSIIQYLAYKNNQPLIIMNLSSFTQISDFIGKVEILPGFKFEFQPGPFAQAVQEGLWILLDEANLASDSILRVIEDVLELGYITLYGSQINSHIDLVDGTLTIKKHQNFKLFLTQNPATDQKFAASRNVFSPSLMSQFIPIKFEPMSMNDLNFIIDEILAQKIQELKEEPEEKISIQQLSSLIMMIYEEIKLKNMDDGLFTLRDIVQIIDFIFVTFQQDKQKIFELLPLKDCMKLISTQFIYLKKNRDLINYQIDQNKFIANTIDRFDQTKDQREQEIRNWNNTQQLKFLSFHETLFSMLTLCYKTKRAALVVGQQFCGKLSSILLWLKLQNIQKYEILELSSSTNAEDLFGKYQPTANGFDFIIGPVTRCFHQGKVLILTNFEAPDCALTESLNGILEKKFLQLLVQNEKYQRHQDFAIIAISSDFAELDKKFTPALKSRFLSIFLDFKVNIYDIMLLFQLSNLPCDMKFVSDITSKLIKQNDSKISNNLETQIEQIQFNKIIRFLKPIQEIQKFAQAQFNINLQQKVIECIDFFIALSLQDNQYLLNEKTQVPLHYQELQSNDCKKNNFIVTSSRKIVTDIIAIAVAAKIPLVLQGTAGVGKTKVISTFQQTCKLFESTSFHYINLNQNTDINDLMGQFVSSCNKDKKEFILKKGPLYLGMEQGGIVLLDEANLSDASILNFLASVAKYPSEFQDPVSNQVIKVHEKFRIFFAQNPPSYNCRTELPQTMASKVIVVEVPNYSYEEVIKICTEQQLHMQKDCIKQGMEYFLTTLIPYPQDGNEKLLNFNGTQFTLRQFIRFRNRLEKTNFSTKQPNWENILQLHQMILFPKDASEEQNLESNINQKQQSLFFSIKNHKAELEISFQIGKNYKKYQSAESNLNSNQRLVLCKIAFCCYFKENILITGRTSSKTYLSQLFTQLVEFQNPQPFELIYISSETEITNLIGSMESHNQESYEKYCQNLIQKLDDEEQKINQNGKNIESIFKELNEKYNQKEFFDQVIKNIGNQFPFIERGLTFSARFGGVACLKNISMADQSVIEGLNALLEIEPHFIVNGQEIKLNNEFFVIAILNTTFGGQLSDALQSRLTKIKIQVPQLINSSKILDTSYQNYILSKFQKKTESDQIIQFIQNLLIITKQFKEVYYENISDRKFYQWMSFLDLDLDATNLQKLALGFQFTILDKYRENYEEIIKDTDLREHFKQAENKIFEKLKEKQFFNSSKIIVNPSTTKILQRIYSAISTQYIPCLIGPPGVGKSAIAQEVASIIKKEHCRVCCSDSLSVEDLFGSYAPKIDNNKVVFIFQEGYLAQALSQKSLILFDEVNLASPEVLSTLQALFNTDDKEIRIKDSRLNKDKCVFLCSMNPQSYEGRQVLPQCIQNLLCDVYIEAFSIDQVLDIFQQRYKNEIKNLQNAGINFQQILDLHKELALLASQKQQSNYDFNIRFLENLLQLFSQQFLDQRQKLSDERHQLELIIVCLDIIYVQHFYQTEFTKQALQIILDKFGLSEDEWMNRRVFLEQNANIIKISRQIGKDFKPIFNFALQNQIQPQISNNSFVINLQNSSIFEKLFIAIQSKKVILCQGDVSSGKTSCIIKIANLLNQRFILLPIHCDLETDDLLGNFALVNPNYDYIQQELERVALKQKSKFILNIQQKKEMNMKYIEGVLKICCKFGYWLILDNINLARAEIVERLNSLGEDTPRLFINEFGDSNACIIPHKNFRLICLQNPSRQDSHILSPAFYNRCIKINFQIDLTDNYIDIIEILTRSGLGQQLQLEDTVILASNLLKQITFIKEQSQCQINLRSVIKAFRMIQENGVKSYDQIMEIIFGSDFRECKNHPDFPIYDFRSQTEVDSFVDKCTDTILNKLISNSFQIVNYDQTRKLLDLKNLSKFLKTLLAKKDLQNYQNFIEGISKEILLVNCQTENQYDLGCYEIQVNGDLNIQLCLETLKIQPTFLSLYIKNKELLKFILKSKCQFQQYIFVAEARLNSEGQLLIQFQQSNDISLVPLIKSLIGPSHQLFFKTFKHLLSKADIECLLLLDQNTEIFFNFNLNDYTFSNTNCKFKDISGKFIVNKENITTQFYLSCDLHLELNYYFIKKGKFGRINDLISLRGEICIPQQNIVQMFLDYGCYSLISNIYVSLSENFVPYLDLEEKNIKLSLECEEFIQVYKLPFQLKFNKILIDILLKQQITINGNINCSFQILNQNICNLTAIIQKKKILFQLLDGQNKNNSQKILQQFLLNYFDKDNIFMSNLSQNKNTTIKQLEIITNSICWNYQLIFEFNWIIKIFKIIDFQIKTMDIYCHIDEKNKQFTICFTAEILKFIFEIEVEFDFLDLFCQNKKKILLMKLIKGKNTPKLKEIIAALSTDLEKQFSKIQGFEKVETIQFQQKESSQQIFNLDEFKKLGLGLYNQFEKEAHQMQSHDYNSEEVKLQKEKFQSNLEQKIEQELKKKQPENYNQEEPENENENEKQIQESVIIWGKQIKMKFRVDLLDSWKISKFLCLSKCYLKIIGLNENFELNLKGTIIFIEFPLVKFKNLLSPESSFNLDIEKEILLKDIDPITFGFGLFGLQFEEIQIIPKVNNIVKFYYDMQTNEFEGDLQYQNFTNQYHQSGLEFLNIQLIFNQYRDRSCYANLKIRTVFFQQQIDFLLEFQDYLYQEQKTQLKINSYEIKNFNLNQFINNSVRININEQEAKFEVNRFTFILLLEKNQQWQYIVQLLIDESSCKILDFIELQQLNGYLDYRNNNWEQSCLSGKCYIKNIFLGTFDLKLNQKKRGFYCDFQYHKDFKLNKFFRSFFKKQIDLYCFRKINFDNLEIELELNHNCTLFTFFYEVKEYSLTNYLMLENINTYFSNEDDNDYRELILRFDFKLCDDFKQKNLSIDLLKDTQNFVSQFELEQLDLLKFLQKLNQYFDFQIPLYEYFKNLKLMQMKCNLTLTKNCKFQSLIIENQHILSWKNLIVQFKQVDLQLQLDSQQKLKLNFEVEIFNIPFSIQYDQSNTAFKFIIKETNQLSAKEIFAQIEQIKKIQFYEKLLDEFSITDQILQLIDLSSKNNNIFLKLQQSYYNINLYYNFLSQTLIFQYEFDNKKKFQDIISHLSQLDYVLKLENADCLIIYTSEKNKTDITQLQENTSYKNYLKFFEQQQISKPGISCFADCQTQISSHHQQTLIFLQKKIDLQISYQEGKFILAESQDTYYKNVNFNCQFNIKLQHKNYFYIQLEMKQFYRDFGSLMYKGQIKVDNNSLEGQLDLLYKEPFAINGIEFKGQFQLKVKEQKIIQSVGSLTGKIHDNDVNVILFNYDNFIPKAWAVVISNTNFYNSLQIFGMNRIFPKDFEEIFERTQRILFIHGQIDIDLKNPNFPPELMQKLSDTKFSILLEKFGSLDFSKFKIQFKDLETTPISWKSYSPVFIMIKDEEENQNFVSQTSLLFNNGNTFIGKGQLKFYFSNLLTDCDLTYKIDVLTGKFDCDADFSIEIFGFKQKLMSKYILGQGFPLSFNLQKEIYFLEFNINYFLHKIKGSIELNLFKDITKWIYINKLGFEFGFDLTYFTLGIQCNFIVSFKFENSEKEYNYRKPVDWNWQAIMGILNNCNGLKYYLIKLFKNIDLSFDLFRIKWFLGLKIKLDDYYTKQQIYNRKTELQALFKSSFDVDISDELNKIEKEVDYYEQQIREAEEKEREKIQQENNKKDQQDNSNESKNQNNQPKDNQKESNQSQKQQHLNQKDDQKNQIIKQNQTVQQNQEQTQKLSQSKNNEKKEKDKEKVYIDEQTNNDKMGLKRSSSPNNTDRQSTSQSNSNKQQSTQSSNENNKQQSSSSNYNCGQETEKSSNQNNKQSSQQSQSSNSNNEQSKSSPNQNNKSSTSNSNNGQSKVSQNQNNLQQKSSSNSNIEQSSQYSNNQQQQTVKSSNSNNIQSTSSSNSNNRQPTSSQNTNNQQQQTVKTSSSINIQSSSSSNSNNIQSSSSQNTNNQLKQTVKSSNSNYGQSLSSSNSNIGQSISSSNSNIGQSISSSNSNIGQSISSSNSNIGQSSSSNSNNGQSILSSNSNNGQSISSSNSNNGQSSSSSNSNNIQSTSSSNSNNGQSTSSSNSNIGQSSSSNSNNGQSISSSNSNNGQSISSSNSNNGQSSSSSNSNNIQSTSSSNSNNGQSTSSSNSNIGQSSSSNSNNGQSISSSNSNNGQSISSSNSNNGQSSSSSNSNNIQSTSSSNSNNGQSTSSSNSNIGQSSSSNSNNGQSISSSNSNNGQSISSSNSNNGQSSSSSNSNNIQSTSSSNSNNGQSTSSSNSNNGQSSSSNSNNGQSISSSNSNNGQSISSSNSYNVLSTQSSNSNNGQLILSIKSNNGQPTSSSNQNDEYSISSSTPNNEQQTVKYITNSESQQTTIYQLQLTQTNENTNTNISHNQTQSNQIILCSNNLKKYIFEDYFDSNIYLKTKLTKSQQKKKNTKSQKSKPLEQEQEINNNTEITDYNKLLFKAEQQLYQQWQDSKQTKNDIKNLSFRIIITEQYLEQSYIQYIGLLLLQFSYLNLTYDIILSGQNQAIFLKQKEDNLTLILLDSILHAIHGQCNKEFILVNEDILSENDFILLLTKQFLEMSNQCKEELLNQGFTTIIQSQDEFDFNIIEVQNGQTISSLKNLIELLNYIVENQIIKIKQIDQNLLDQQKVKQYKQEFEPQLESKEANSIKALLEVSKFTKYSLSSKGTTIDIKGIIKFFCTNGTARDIMKRKNRGGKSFYFFQVVLDLSQLEQDTLSQILLPFLLQFIEICKQCQLVCNLIILDHTTKIIKSNFSTSWTEQEQTLLIQSLINYSNETSVNQDHDQFQFILDQFQSFSKYKKYLLFINHSFYTYSCQNLQLQLNMAQQMQIKIISLGLDLKKYINHSLGGVIQFPLTQQNSAYQIITNLLQKDYEAQIVDGTFQFYQNMEKYPNTLELLQVSSEDSQYNCYLNKYFNYIQSEESNKENDQASNEVQNEGQNGDESLIRLTKLDLFLNLLVKLNELQQLMQGIQKKDSDQQKNQNT
ncbi:unnamed protein product [Paramecium pentaurelia]|uniref:AAA+ ATPase domain-containing protein n=1 Tax=Paramecium pentaurelia TaxID=43138 RepID=A0A8S1YBC2_9CILI|nr:unnamed protein product [Paramecium pentaurelia]